MQLFIPVFLLTLVLSANSFQPGKRRELEKDLSEPDFTTPTFPFGTKDQNAFRPGARRGPEEFETKPGLTTPQFPFPKNKVDQVAARIASAEQNDVGINNLALKDKGECQTTLHLKEGETKKIASTDFPIGRGGNKNCTITFQAPDYFYITVYCEEVKLRNNGCQDNVLLSGGYLNRLLCGSNGVNEVFTSENTKLKFSFRSTSNILESSSFSCSISAIDTKPTLPPSIPEYNDKTCRRCGQINSPERIVGGVDTEEFELGWQVGFIFAGGLNDEISLFCGGSIINDRYLLTAAHCADTIKTNKVIVGAHDLSEIDPNEVLDVEEVRPHPEYNPSTMVNDIAIVKLNDKLPLSDKVMPICLPDPNREYKGEVMASGWGSLEEGGAQPTVQQKVTLDILPDMYCIPSYSSYYRPAYMMCAGNYSGGQDSCQGDSGGPLVHYDSKLDTWVLLGVTSFGYGCAREHYPGVYARVTEYVSWIEKETSDGGNDLCDGEVDDSESTPLETTKCLCGSWNAPNVRDSRVIGGDPAKPKMFPSLALLPISVDFNGEIMPNCGGVIISENWILTLAACAPYMHYFEAAVLDAHDASEWDRLKVVHIAETIIHPKYQNDEKSSNNLALLRVERPMSFWDDLEYGPICLPKNPIDDINHLKAILSGWGQTSNPDKNNNARYPNALHSMSLELYESGARNCRTYGFEDIVCGEARDGIDADACYGDEGSPVLRDVGGTWSLAGIVATYSCNAVEDFPIKIVRADKHLDWIQDVTNGEYYNDGSYYDCYKRI